MKHIQRHYYKQSSLANLSFHATLFILWGISHTHDYVYQRPTHILPKKPLNAYHTTSRFAATNTLIATATFLLTHFKILSIKIPPLK